MCTGNRLRRGGGVRGVLERWCERLAHSVRGAGLAVVACRLCAARPLRSPADPHRIRQGRGFLMHVGRQSRRGETGAYSQIVKLAQPQQQGRTWCSDRVATRNCSKLALQRQMHSSAAVQHRPSCVAGRGSLRSTALLCS